MQRNVTRVIGSARTFGFGLGLGFGVLFAVSPATAGSFRPPPPPPASPAPSPGPTKPAPPPGSPLKLEALTKAQFDSLPDSAVIEFQGTRTTAGEFRAKLRQRRQAIRREADQLRAKTAPQAKARFEAYRGKFLQQQKAKLDAENAKTLAELNRRRAQMSKAPAPTSQDALRQEARDLLRRAQTAPPAEHAQIERRAQELLRQLQPAPR